VRVLIQILFIRMSLIAEFIDQVMVDSPAGVIPPDRMFELLHERGMSSIAPKESAHAN
jgi:hypothetical protein